MRVIEILESYMTETDLTHKYVSILRCATWHVWPKHSRVVSKTITIPINEQVGSYLRGSIHLVSYENRPRITKY
jgi:hypothetical protein